MIAGRNDNILDRSCVIFAGPCVEFRDHNNTTYLLGGQCLSGKSDVVIVDSVG